MVHEGPKHSSMVITCMARQSDLFLKDTRPILTFAGSKEGSEVTYFETACFFNGT
jgi:hypothetical protein